MAFEDRSLAIAHDRKGYFFHGRFLPERTNIRLTYVDRRARLQDREIQFSLFSFESEFNGRISSDAPFESPAAVQSIVYLLLRSILDRLSYLNVCGYDIDVVGAVSADGTDHHIFGVNEPVFFDDVQAQQEFSKSQIPFCDEIIDLKFHDVRLDTALRCFCHAMRDDALTPLFCFIAIEILARRVVEINDRSVVAEVRSKEWGKFRQILNLKEDTIKNRVKASADDFRHGNFVNTSWESRKEALSLTWEIIRRSMHFIRSKTALSTESFPEL